MVAIVTVLVLIYVVANLLVDLLYAVLDPRIRYVDRELNSNTSPLRGADSTRRRCVAIGLAARSTTKHPPSLWAGRLAQLRRRPLFIISAVHHPALIIVRRSFPGLFTTVAADGGCELANSLGGPRAPGTRSGFDLPGLRHLLPGHPRRARIGHRRRADHHHRPC